MKSDQRQFRERSPDNEKLDRRERCKFMTLLTLLQEINF